MGQVAKVKVGQRKLSANDIQQIQVLLLAGHKVCDIAKDYGVVRQTIGRIRSAHRGDFSFRKVEMERKKLETAEIESDARKKMAKAVKISVERILTKMQKEPNYVLDEKQLRAMVVGVQVFGKDARELIKQMEPPDHADKDPDLDRVFKQVTKSRPLKTIDVDPEPMALSEAVG